MFSYKYHSRKNEYICQSDLCTFCQNERETIFHIFCECDIVKNFWMQFKNWINPNEEIVALDNFEIIFGKLNDNTCINLLIILAKYHIYKQKLKNCHPSISNFKSEVEYYYKLQKHIYKNKNMENDFQRKWYQYIIIRENGNV